MIIEAPVRVDIARPLIFLAGPIQWGGDAWHEHAIALLTQLDPRVHIANPRRDPAASAELWNMREDTAGERFDEAAYNEQLDWETTHLRLAGSSGAVLFWLARERTHNCQRPHAQTTRFELAEYKERAARGLARVAVGIEPGFTGARYIRHRFAQDCPAVPVCDTLEATCRAAIALCAT
jgi:hypothetical protein